ncbi:MAG: RIP metalloprotease RseP [Verrucomicrobiota bacterium]
MHILKVIGIILEVVILFNFIIVVHELGHFLAAKWRGLKVDKFQIWFGKPLWSKTIGGVQYGLGCIPAGGFVALPQMAPMEMLEGSTDDGKPLAPIKPIDKIIVAIAGPLFSFALALTFAMLVWLIGHPVSKQETTRTIGNIAEGAAVGADQLKPGDEILEIDGRKVERWQGMVDSVVWNVVSSQDETIPFKVDRPGVGIVDDIEVTPVAPAPPKDQKWYQGLFKRKELRRVGISPAYQPMVARVFPDSPADRAGLQANDVVVGLNGGALYHPNEISNFINANPGQALTLSVERLERGEKQSVDLQLTPEIPTNYKGTENERHMIGTVWDSTGETSLEHPHPVTQIKQTVQTMINTLQAVFSPKSEIKAQHLAGPVMIMRVYYLLFEAPDGWRRAIWFSVLLNVNLGILNLLPLPVLDGGHITMATVEAIRRKPINLRFLEIVQTASALLLIGFMIYVTGFDLGDWFGEKKAEAQGAPNPIFSEVVPN